MAIDDKIARYHFTNRNMLVNTFPVSQCKHTTFDYFPYFMFFEVSVIKFTSNYLISECVDIWLVADLQGVSIRALLSTAFRQFKDDLAKCNRKEEMFVVCFDKIEVMFPSGYMMV